MIECVYFYYTHFDDDDHHEDGNNNHDGNDDDDDDDDDISLLSFRIRKTRAGCVGALSRSRDELSLFHRSQGRRKVRE